MNEIFEIQIESSFSAGHRLIEPYQGKCSNPHGHNYVVNVTCWSKSLDENGFVLDFMLLEAVLERIIIDYFDHSFIVNLQDRKLIDFLETNKFQFYKINGNPSAENIAKEIYVLLSESNIISDSIKNAIKNVGVEETSSSKARYYIPSKRLK